MFFEASPADARARGPIVVEFLGTPGSGKTTLSAALVALLEERGTAAATPVGAARGRVRRTRVGGIVARLPSRRLRRFLLWQLFYALGVVHGVRFGAEHPALVRQVFDTQLRCHDRIRTRAHTLYWFFHLCGRYRFLTGISRPREVLVLDDGFLQRSVHLHASPVDPPEPDQVSAYVGLIPPPDFVILVSASRATCEQRVLDRGVWSHLRHLDAAALSRYLENAEEVVAAAARRVNEMGWRVTEIETGGVNPRSPDAALRSVVPALVRAGAPEPSRGTGVAP
jgi:RecA/RadA recombinase